MKKVMSFGGGVQSTFIMAAACKGLIPMPDYWLFSDPGFETPATYSHLEFCKEYLEKHGATLTITAAGNIREDAPKFGARMNTNGLRAASIPLFLKKAGEHREAVLPRQCTTEYKIEPIERFLRRTALGLKHGERAPKTASACSIIGISQDEERRATAPGKWQTIKHEIGKDLFGDPIYHEERKWKPCVWQVKDYPLLGYRLHSDQSKEPLNDYDEVTGMDRQDCLDELAKIFPGRHIPRSACICCPYRTNREWREMRDNDPESFAQAVEFDYVIRDAYRIGQQRRGQQLAGVPYVHRRLKPLDQVDLGEELNDRKGCGGLWSTEPDGICGV